MNLLMEKELQEPSPQAQAEQEQPNQQHIFINLKTSH